MATFGLDVNEGPWTYNVLSGGLEEKKSSIHSVKRHLSTYLCLPVSMVVGIVDKA